MAVILALSAPALAQAPKDPAATNQGQVQQPPLAEQMRGDISGDTTVNLHTGEQHRVDALIGIPAQNTAGEKLGSVEDVVIDGDKNVTAFVVSVGGFLGIGSKSVQIEADKAEVTAGADGTGHMLRVDVDRKSLTDAPAYSPSPANESGADKMRNYQGGKPADTDSSASPLPEHDRSR